MSVDIRNFVLSDVVNRGIYNRGVQEPENGNRLRKE